MRHKKKSFSRLLEEGYNYINIKIKLKEDHFFNFKVYHIFSLRT